MDGYDSNDGVEFEEFPVEGEALPPIRRIKYIGEGYFETMGTPMVAGRAIRWTDIEARARVAVISEAIAREYWESPSAAIGQRLRMFGPVDDTEWSEVIGVVADVRDDGTAEQVVPIVYWPQLVDASYAELAEYTPRSLAYAVRVAGGAPGALLPAIRQAVWSVNPNLPLANVATLDEFVRDSRSRTSFTLVMLGIASGVALFLGAVGIYGVISYVVTQRTREIGVRMALGARHADVREMVLRQAATLALVGVGIGVGGAATLTRLMSSLLYGVSPLDPLTFASTAVVLAVVALVSGYLPARRASRVDPIVALRFE
jgi:predicted permease